MGYRKYYTPTWIDRVSFAEMRQAFKDAHAKLAEKDQVNIESEIESMVIKVKEKGQGTQFNSDMANELLGCLGMWLNKELE